MNPDAHKLWQGPQWVFAVLLALLGMLGPFSIDTYLPAFADITRSLDATPVQMQQTLSAYLFGFAFMSLFHGAISDSFGRRPVVLWGLAAFTLASAGCALSDSIGQLIFFRAMQGLSTGAGIVVSRAVIRDMFPPSQAQKVMSQVTIFFGVAPAIAPMVGGWMLAHVNWAGIFWFLTGVGVVLWVAIYRALPETLHVTQRQGFNPKNLMAGYWQRPDETAKVMTADGFFRTGDIGTVDERGYFKIVDRKKDMVLVSGFNVYPNEVEDVVSQLEGVLECAVVGVPDDKTGEAVKLVIVKKDPDLTEARVREYCKTNLTGYKQPRVIEFRAEMPKTPVGKILRRELRDKK